MSQTKLTPFPRRYNVKPTQEVVILAKTPLEPMLARWWLVPSWHRGGLKDWKATTFNARIEEAKDKPAFRAVWRHGRCLIPAAGYTNGRASGAPSSRITSTRRAMTKRCSSRGWPRAGRVC